VLSPDYSQSLIYVSGVKDNVGDTVQGVASNVNGTVDGLLDQVKHVGEDGDDTQASGVAL
jgi:hypothetical protein